MSAPTVLLLGLEAARLAPRLEVSGYRPVEESTTDLPQAVILSPGEEPRIPELRGRWQGVPLLLGIVDDSVAGRIRCLASGADDFWLTALGPSDLLTRLRLHLESNLSPPEGEPPLRVADLEVNPARRAVRRGSREIALTAREYQLLLLLILRAGEVVGREHILREIWDDQPGTASNVIEVYVRYLRQKLEEGGEKRLIHTVRGQGYSLAERPPGRAEDPES
ncbi:response regulator transcription factor [Cyanobium sp. FGCU-6]|jgi:two-component system response regulator MprA|nr:response regulator transcription factor [Cyanobium sp. FGCU6]